MYRDQTFIERRTGQQARIVETKFVEVRAGQLIARYRMSGGTLFLTAAQVRAMYDEVKLQTAGEQVKP